LHSSLFSTGTSDCFSAYSDASLIVYGSVPLEIAMSSELDFALIAAYSFLLRLHFCLFVERDLIHRESWLGIALLKLHALLELEQQ
jgi:hypothetical protein